MLGNYLIGLREGLEAALVISILVAYLVRSGHREALPALWAGVLAAIGLAVATGAILTFGPSTLTFEAQEAIGGTLSILAVGLITWMIFWMARTARTLKSSLQGRLDDAIAAGRWAIFVMALLAVGREGLETALFLWAGAQASGQTASPLLGALAGLGTAVVIGWAFYRGALRIDLRRFFAWTGLFLIVVSAGVLAYGVHDLQEAGILPGLNDLAFDVSAVIPPTGIVGTVLKGVFNFSPATTWLEAAAWLLYLVPTLILYRRIVWGPASSAPPRQGAGSAIEPSAAPASTPS